MKNDCPPIFPEITDQEKQVEYITTIVKCEREQNDIPLVNYLAVGLANYLKKRLSV